MPLAITAFMACTASASATVALEPFPDGAMTNDTLPTFSGSATDVADPVTVEVYSGPTAAGSPVLTLSSSPSAISGGWSVAVTTPLEDGTYTAVAEQLAVGSGERSESAPYTFTIDTLPPTVTLDQPTSPSNVATPSFSGTASDTTPVTVSVYSGASREGTPVAALRVRASGGRWTTANLNPALADGTYSATATQPSSLGNANGVSNLVTFEINTRAPTVTLDQPPSPSNDTTPSFSGTASDSTTVTVEVFEGTKAEGAIIATVTAQGTRGAWSSGHLAPGLPPGRHTFTAVATQTSSLRNAAGRSAPVTFAVDTEPPALTLRSPPSRSNDTTPSFSGTASEGTTVTVEIYEGTAASGALIATATAAPAAGAWISAAASPALHDGTFTAIAIEPSAIGNAAGRSAPVTFAIDTAPPTVTLKTPPSPSSNRYPSFSGTASDQQPVTIDIYTGARAEGPVVASATGEAVRGEWLSARLSAALEWGTYTAVATQPSSIGNATGTSAPVTFAVVPIPPTVATEAPSLLTRTSATLYASVDPEGGPVSGCYFEYGTTTAYGTTIECGLLSEANAFPSAGTSAVPVLARIFGLQASTTYHFRIVAIGEGGTAVGADETFTTLPPYSFAEEGSRAARAASLSTRSATATGLSANKLESLLAKQLTRMSRKAHIVALLKNGAFKTSLDAPEAGTVEVAWQYVPPIHGRAGISSRKPLVVATARLSVRNAGMRALTMRLTASGRDLLKHASQLHLEATCKFAPPRAHAVTASASIVIPH